MSRTGPPELGAGPAAESYLAKVTALLPGPARAQAGIVAELRSGLLDAADAHRSAGLPPAQAARAAIREFGDPALVAAGFRAEIAASQARRVAVALLATGPLVGLLWIATAVTSHLGIAPPWQWTGLSPGLGVGLRLVAVAVGVTAFAAIVGIATTGRLTRLLPARPRRLGLALLAAQLATAPGRLSPLLAVAAAAASLARLMLARRAARQCLASRANLA